ncbi:MAG: phosphoribosylanthranilate isomerase [Planctomycetota bacterium]|nr:phosphoribosylanthranilate isomerase [Planctomycetota bacterium]
MSRTRIKICGIRDAENALVAADAGADAIGFIFVRSSPRFIQPLDAADIMSVLPPMVTTVGVYMDTPIDAFSDVEEDCPTHYSQLHGSEAESLVNQCAPVIKGLKFLPDSLAEELRRWDACDAVEAILIDSPTPGSGAAFEWEMLVPLIKDISKPIFLAGGLTPDNVADAIRTVRPYGVDVSSGVERERGIKDPDLIEAFCNAVREADRA